MSQRDNQLVVRDLFELRPGAARIRAVTPVADTDVHSPSARLSGASRIDNITVPRSTAEAWAAGLNQGRLTLVSLYALDPDGRLRFMQVTDERSAANRRARVETA
jgi:hypothetical protein